MVQKSGYFSRSAAPNAEDLALIRACADRAAEAALRGESGVVGQDEAAGDVLRVCEFPRIKGGKAFDPTEPWFTGPDYGIADIALFAYTDVAPHGGFDLSPYPAVRDWLARVRKTPGFVPMAAPDAEAAALIDASRS